MTEDIGVKKIIFLLDIKFIETPSPIGNFVNVRFSGK